MATDRSVNVTLRMAAQDYISNAKKARTETDALAKSQDSAAKKVAAQHEAMTKVGTGMLVAGGALAAGLALAVKSAADFDKTLSAVQAVSGATSAEMGNLRTAALQAGADTVFSASEAAQAEVELAKVGLSTADILGGALTGSLNLAAAGGLGLADAATIAGQTMKIFGLAGKDVSHIADVLASGANKSAADVSTLSQALSQSGLQAAQTGLSLEDTVGTLSLFADNALNGSDAGTSFKTMLSRLVPQTDEQAAAMRTLGLDFFDANGNFIGIEQSAEMLKNQLGNLSVEQRQSALNTIFGSDAIRAATVLYQAGGAGVREYVQAVNDQGAAARVASVQMNNLSGDFETLKGSIETALIQGGSSATGILRGLTQAATNAVNAFGALPESVQSVAFGFAGVASGVLLLGGGMLTLIPKIAAARAAMVELGVTSTAVRALLGGPFGVALAGGTLLLGLFAKSQIDAANNAQALRDSLDQTTGAITDQTRAMVAKNLQDSGAFAIAKQYGVSLKDVTDAALGQADAMDRVQAAQTASVSATEASSNAIVKQNKSLLDGIDNTNMLGKSTLDLSEGPVTQQRAAFGTLTDAIKTTSDVLGGTAKDQQDLAEATGKTTTAASGLTAAQYEEQQSAADVAKAAQEVADAYDKARKAFIDYGNAVSGAIDANVAYRQALADANKQLLDQNGNLDKTKLGLDANTQAGRDNLTALTGLAQKAKENALAAYDQTQKTDTLTNSIKSSREEFVAVAVKMGATKQRANEMATQLGLTTINSDLLNNALGRQPKETNTTVKADTRPANAAVDGSQRKLDAIDGRTASATVTANTSQANASLDAFRSNLERINGSVATTYVNTVVQGSARKLAADVVTGRAEGGPIYGPGTSTSDSIPAMLSNGEYVVKAAAVARYGMTFFDRVNAMRFADGGYVSRAASAPAAAGPSAPTVSIANVTTTGTPDAVGRAIVTRLGDAMAVNNL